MLQWARSEIPTADVVVVEKFTINQRTINTTVWVQSGQTIVLGGLIRSDKSLQKSGLPTLHKLPLLGPLFGQTDQTSDRTELLVMLTPRIVRVPATA